ncbi:MAG: hypothetical protein AAGI38_01230 [Bacteroidota bacterium]
MLRSMTPIMWGLGFCLIFCLMACEDKPKKTASVPQAAPQTTQPPLTTALPNPDLESQLIGTWESVSMVATVYTMLNGDSTVTQTIRAEDWETAMGMKPIQTILKADHTYKAIYRTLEDSVFLEPYGKWSVTGNVLTYQEVYPNPLVVKQEINPFSPTHFQFKSVTDYDRDGQKDDEVIAISKKISD